MNKLLPTAQHSTKAMKIPGKESSCGTKYDSKSNWNKWNHTFHRQSACYTSELFFFLSVSSAVQVIYCKFIDYSVHTSMLLLQSGFFSLLLNLLRCPLLLSFLSHPFSIPPLVFLIRVLGSLQMLSVQSASLLTGHWLLWLRVRCILFAIWWYIKCLKADKVNF